MTELSESASASVREAPPIAADPSAPHAVVSFPDGLPGFEAFRRFVLASADGDGPLRCLQAVDRGGPSFLVIDPLLALKRYRMELSPADRTRLDVRQGDALVWLAIVTVTDDESATVNLRAPIVVNPRVMVGFQLMPHHGLYPIRYPLDV
jgi:flagellar assembly factor FliW